jgi:hypothetical protein
MKSIQRAHIVVVAGSDQGFVLAARLWRMEVARVTAVAALEQARGLCQAGSADGCIVAFDDFVPDAGNRCAQAQVRRAHADGRPDGYPHLRKMARRYGYLAAVPATILPRMFYCRLRAAPQRRRAAAGCHW